MKRFHLAVTIVAFSACLSARGQGEGVDEAPVAEAAAVEDPVTMKVLQEVWEGYERSHAQWPGGTPEAEAFAATAMDLLVGREGVGYGDVRSAYLRMSDEEEASPVAMAVYGMAVSRGTTRGEARALRVLPEAIEALRASGSGFLRCSLAASRLGEVQYDWGEDEGCGASYELSLEQFLLACAEPGLGALEQRYLFSKLSRPALRGVELEWGEDFVVRFTADQRIDPWLKAMVAGDWHLAAGWRARGSGFSDTVTEEGWGVFRERLAQAREHYLCAYEAHPERPEAATQMIGIAMAGHAAEGESEELWFERATAAQFDWMKAYDALAWALRPRWDGSIEEMVRFGLRCAATERYDTPVPRHMVYMLVEVSEDMKDFDAVWRQRGLYPVVRRVLKETVESDPEGAIVPALRTDWAVAAWKAGRYEEAREQLELLGRKIEGHRLAQFNAAHAELLADVYAHTGPASALVRRAERAGARGDWERAAEIFGEAVVLVRKAKGRNRVEQNAILDRMVLAEFMHSFRAGNWTELPAGYFGPTPDAPAGWRADFGRLRRNMDGQYEGRDEEGLMRFIVGAPVGRRFEFEATVDTREAKARWGSGGIIFGYSDAVQDPFYWTLRVSRDREQPVSMGRRLFNACGPAQVETRGKDDLSVVVWDDWALARVNGQVVFQGELPFRRSDPAGGLIGLCSGDVPEGSVIKFLNARVRKLEAPPAEMAELEWDRLDGVALDRREEGAAETEGGAELP